MKLEKVDRFPKISGFTDDPRAIEYIKEELAENEDFIEEVNAETAMYFLTERLSLYPQVFFCKVGKKYSISTCPPNEVAVAIEETLDLFEELSSNMES